MALVVVALQAAACRWAPAPVAVIGIGVAAVALLLWPQPLILTASPYERIGISAAWVLPTVLSIVVGGYPRLMDHRLRRALVEARHAQQLSLAHDLHDLVAHDVSGIVAQAQAARFVAGHDPTAAVPALERIERAGLAALDSIDQSVELLRDPALSREPLPDLDRLRETVHRFTDTGPAQTRMDIDPAAADALSRVGAATVHRVVLEALTNVRRHAAQANHVHIDLTLDGAAVRLTVSNDLRPGRPHRRRRGGTGLRTLAERVRDLNGTLETTSDDGEWVLAVTLPAAPNGGHP